MGEAVIIYGRSGSGKSRSMKNFGSEEVFLVQTIRKKLPFRTNFKYVAIRYTSRVWKQVNGMIFYFTQLDPQQQN